MSDEHRPEDSPEIGSLLADRDRLRGWLDRLDQADSTAPETVRHRVRADYEGRLAEVVARLSTYTTALEASLANLRAQLSHISDLRLEAQETRAEASLRHSVGEFGDEEWQRMEDQAAGKIAGLSGDLDRLRQEANRLEEVLAQVAPPAPEPEPEAVTQPASRRAPGDDFEVDVIEAEEVSLSSRIDTEGAGMVQPVEPVSLEPEQLSVRQGPVEAPRFTPKGDRPPARERPVRTLRFPAPAPEPRAATPAGNPVDEMTFLKSVTLETQAAEDKATEAKASARSPRSPNSAAKTLKCTDCGAMNRPTEWYCERCGAELAGV